jgi:phytoene dehydrogenase-like protein
MNKRLETLLERIPTWPEEAQEDAVMVLSDIEEKIRVLRSLSPEDQAKLAALRADIDRAYEQGGSFTDEEVEASIEAELDAWEQNRKGA